MTSLFKRSAAAVFIRGSSDEGKGEAGGAVSSQTAGCGPRAAPEEMPREGRMPTARKHSADVRCRQKQKSPIFVLEGLLRKPSGSVLNKENGKADRRNKFSW
jgi:hypothetical protein